MLSGRIVEHLLYTRRKAGQGFLARRGNEEYIIPAFAPGGRVDLVVAPLPRTFARLGFFDAFSHAMCPNVMDWVCSYRGSYHLSSTICDSLITNGYDCSCVLTESNPCYVQLFNTSNLSQWFQAISYFLVIETEEDYLECLDLLDTLTGSKIESLANEAVELLSRMKVALPLPKRIT